jgi:hypothetical protein
MPKQPKLNGTPGKKPSAPSVKVRIGRTLASRMERTSRKLHPTSASRVTTFPRTAPRA